MKEFNALLKKENVNRLEYEGGAYIVYTHFAYNFVDSEGRINEDFIEKIKYISSKAGWFVPAGVFLDYLLSYRENHYASKAYLTALDLKWVLDRVIKRVKFHR